MLTALALAPWFQSELLPLMDYPMFLAFVRVWLDLADPTSPLGQHYQAGWPLAPLSLPLALTAGLARWTSIETAGRWLHVAYVLGGLGAGAWVLRVLGRSQWHLLLLFPLLFGKWLSSGFVGFVTGIPWALLALGLSVRRLEAPRRADGALLAAVLVTAALWHGLVGPLAVLVALLVQACWRDTPRRHLRLAWPLLPSMVLLPGWALSSWGSAPEGSPADTGGLVWAPLAARLAPGPFFDRLLMLFPGAAAWAVAFTVLIGVATFLSRAEPSLERGLSHPRWRVDNPASVVTLAALALYVALPQDALGVEIVGPRFAWVAAVFLVFSFRLPREGAGAVLVPAALFLLSAAYLLQIGARARRFHEETIGASRLIASLPPGESLLAPVEPADADSFLNVPLREIQQYATVRHGSLPATSFAAYGMNPILPRGPRPRPALGPREWRTSPALQQFDWLLLRRPSPADQQRSTLLLNRRDGDWWLFRVCAGVKAARCSERAPPAPAPAGN